MTTFLPYWRTMKKVTREPTRAEIFLDVFEHWRKKYKLKPIETRKDLRYHCHACLSVWLISDEHHKKGYTELVYNPRRLAKWCHSFLINGALHEIGHYVHNLDYNTWAEQVYSEYKAESFALRVMKRCYTVEYKDCVNKVKNKLMKNKRWVKKNPLYYQAFLKIKEYND